MIGALTLDQLRVLVAIADSGSFSAAGRQLGRAQSAISQAVATLEGVQGVALFDRSGYRPQLTETGRVLVDQARLVLASAARFEAVAAGSRAGLEAELTVAIDPLVPSAPLIDSLRSLGEAYPDLPLSFSTEGLGGALRRLRDGTASLAICLLLPAVPEDVVAHPLLRLPLRSVAAAHHPLARGSPARRRRAIWRPMSSSCSPTRWSRRGRTTAWRARVAGASSTLAGGSTSCSPASAGAACRSIWSPHRWPTGA